MAQTVTAQAAVEALTPAAPPQLQLGTIKTKVPPVTQAAQVADANEAALRAELKYETVRWNGKPVLTLDEGSRVLLVKAAAREAGLDKVGLSFHDVYGIIEAETSWIPRTGASKDGTANLGLAQFEPRTAQGLGIEDPSDPVEAVFGAAKYMKDGAKWASAKLDGLKLSPDERAAKLREGISIHYNLSIKGRNKWDGHNSAALPIETQRHIANARAGAAEAAHLARTLRA
ncbi:hypothetical protein [Ramlibacter sp.]|uniref:hypothetical protein n=1 Tax=Ramlibacter sp. TaxID=1917967 RepID=UPI003D0B1FCD